MIALSCDRQKTSMCYTPDDASKMESGISRTSLFETTKKCRTMEEVYSPALTYSSETMDTKQRRNTQTKSHSEMNGRISLDSKERKSNIWYTSTKLQDIRRAMIERKQRSYGHILNLRGALIYRNPAADNRKEKGNEIKKRKHMEGEMLLRGEDFIYLVQLI